MTSVVDKASSELIVSHCMTFFTGELTITELHVTSFVSMKLCTRMRGSCYRDRVKEDLDWDQ